MAEVTTIRIDGLREFRKALRDTDAALPKMVRVASNKAAQIIVDEAVPRVPLGPAKGGHARDSIRAASTQTAARVREGGKKYPYMPWLDFGGRVGPRKSVQRPFIRSGRYIWSALGDRFDDVQATLVDALAEVAREAGLDVERT